MAAKNCVECGAELQVSSNSCPLCGAERKESAKWTASKKKVEPADLEDYQASVRELHEQLRKIRDDGAQAV